MKKVLIDTNVYSLAMKGDATIVNVMRAIDHIGISAISIGELFSGFKGGRLESKNRQELYCFLDSPRVKVYAVDVETADLYGSILHALRSAGTPVPTNDIWIAAVAFQHGLRLYTRDRHFQAIPGIIPMPEEG